MRRQIFELGCFRNGKRNVIISGVLCACCTLILVELVRTAPTSNKPEVTTTEEPEVTSEPPGLTTTSESPVMSLDKTALLLAEISAFSTSLYARAHFDELIEKHKITNESTEIENTVLKHFTRPSLPENILSRSHSCTDIKGILKSVMKLLQDNIQLSEGIANSGHRQADSSTIMGLKSMSDKVSEMLGGASDQQSSGYSPSEVNRLTRDLIDVLATVAHIRKETDTLRTVFSSLRLCIH